MDCDLLISNPVDSDNSSSPFSESSEYTSEGSLVCPSSEYICSNFAEAGDLGSDNSGVTVVDVNCVVERKGRSVSPLTVSSDTMEEGDSVEINASDGTGLSHSDLTRILSSLASGFSEMRTAAGTSASSGEAIELNRQINNLAPHKDGADIAKYIRKLEADLEDLGCPSTRFKSVLFQKMQSKTGSSIVASLDRTSTTYAQLKEILIDALGSSLTSLGAKLTTEFQNTTRSMSPLETYVHLKNLTDSMDMMTHSKEDLLLFIACATYRASRPFSQRAIMDQREFKSFRDLNKFALSINSTEPERPSVGRFTSRSTFGSPYECYKCHKLGHRAFECRSNVSSPTFTYGGSGKPPSVVCYTCREPGHKSPDCPTKRSDSRDNGDSKADTSKIVGLLRSTKGVMCILW